MRGVRCQQNAESDDQLIVEHFVQWQPEAPADPEATYGMQGGWMSVVHMAEQEA